MLKAETPNRTAHSFERAELRGRVLDGRYCIGEVLGIGGTAVAFEAVRLVDGENLVVKVLRPTFVDNPDLVRRLKREGEVARTVVHPSIVTVYDEGILSGFEGADGSPYIVMERIRGECMQRLLRRTGVLSPDIVGAIAMRVATILHASHQHGYIHRDVKPEHIFMDRADDGSLRIRLLDFGVCASARAPRDEREREQGRVFGTPSYVSPEQASGNPDVDGRADIFGLGIVMFEAKTRPAPASCATTSPSPSTRSSPAPWPATPTIVSIRCAPSHAPSRRLSPTAPPSIAPCSRCSVWGPRRKSSSQQASTSTQPDSGQPVDALPTFALGEDAK